MSKSQISQKQGILKDPPEDEQAYVAPPLIERRETDKDIKIVFLVTVILTFIFSIVSILAGNPHKLSNPIDPDGRPCGQGELAEYPYIYFATPSQQYLHRTVCVKKCESLQEQPEPGDSLECYPNSVVKSCEFNIQKDDRNEEVLIYDSKIYLNKICMPLNIVYFKLIRDALDIDKMDQMLSDFRVAFPWILLFGALSFLLSYLTKFLVDKKELITCAINTFFAASTAGFLILGILFTYRVVNLIQIQPPNDKEVVADPKNINDNIDQQNSSIAGNLIFALFCFINVGIYINQYIEYDQDKTPQGQQIVRMRNEMLLFISDVIKSQSLIYLPLVTFSLFFIIFGFFFYVQTNVYSIGSTKNDTRGLPFDQFQRNPITNILGLLIFIGFFWIFIFIIQACEYVVYKLAINELKSRNEKQKNPPDNSIIEQVKIIFSLRIGTIAYCSLLSFFFFHIRACFEWIDTKYQHKLDIEKQKIIQDQKNQQKNDQKNEQNNNQKNNDSINIPHTGFMKFQKMISDFYQSSFLKSIQPYGFIYTIKSQLNFREAGLEMQKTIDSTSFWFEDMLDGGEIFENQIIFSITFIISLCFLLIIQSFDKYEVSSILVPVFLMIIVSYVISLLYVNMYGSIYSSFIIFYLVNKYKDYQDEKFDNQKQLNYFEKFIGDIVNESTRPSANPKNQKQQQLPSDSQNIPPANPKNEKQQ